MSSFAALKKASSLESLVEKLEKKSGGGDSFQDDRFWKPTQDKATGLGSAVIRFLPTSPDGDAPWVQLFNHAFQDDSTGKWFIEECPSTIGKDCPICNFARPYWKGSDADKAIARQKGRKISYVSNILVVKDPENPENEGKIFLYKYGRAIFNKITEMMKPQFESDTPVNPFDFWGGANFNLRLTKNAAGYRSYDKSVFAQPSALFDGDDNQLEALWNKQYDLKEFLAEDKFKSAEEIQQKFDNFNGASAPAASSAANRVLEQLGQAEPKAQQETKAESKVNPAPAQSSGGDESSWEDLLKDL